MNSIFYIILAVVVFFVGVVIGIKDTKKTFKIPKGTLNADEFKEYVLDNYERF